MIELDGRRFSQSPFGEVNWVRNLRSAGEAVVSKGNLREDMTADEVPPEERGTILRETLRPYLGSRFTAPVARWLFNLRADSTLDEYVAEARRHPMFELHARPG